MGARELVVSRRTQSRCRKGTRGEEERGGRTAAPSPRWMPPSPSCRHVFCMQSSALVYTLPLGPAFKLGGISGTAAAPAAAGAPAAAAATLGGRCARPWSSPSSCSRVLATSIGFVTVGARRRSVSSCGTAGSCGARRRRSGRTGDGCACCDGAGYEACCAVGQLCGVLGELGSRRTLCLRGQGGARVRIRHAE